MSKIARNMVSLKKRRFVEDGFDLDLSYITPQIIAMGFPSEGVEGMYRNPLKEVQKFFNTYHPDQYKVYNLCAEKTYKVSHFKSFAHFGFVDHNPPPLKLLVELIEDVVAYLAESKEHVAALHCKAGKGRTGAVIAALLLRMGKASEPAAALNMFGKKRTKNNRGVTIPSQQRYVRYYHEYLKHKEEIAKAGGFKEPALRIKSLVLFHSPAMKSKGGCTPILKIEKLEEVSPGFREITTVFDMRKEKGNKIKSWKPKEPARTMGPKLKDVQVQGDFRVSFFDRERWTGNCERMCSFWLNTAFLREKSIVLTRGALDGPHKELEKPLIFHKDFTIQLYLGGDGLEGVGTGEEEKKSEDPSAISFADVNGICFVPEKISQPTAGSKADGKLVRHSSPAFPMLKLDGDKDDEDDEDDLPAPMSRVQRRSLMNPEALKKFQAKRTSIKTSMRKSAIIEEAEGIEGSDVESASEDDEPSD